MRVIDSLEEFQRLAGQYDRLLDFAPSRARAYSSHGWLCAWWRAYGKGRRVAVFCAEQNGSLIAAIPLVFEPDHVGLMPMRRAAPVGGTWGWFAPAADPRHEALWSQVLRELFEGEATDWEIAQIGLLSPDATTTAAFIRAMEIRQIPFQIVERRSAYLTLPPTWDAFLASRSRNFRRTVKRKEAAASKSRITLRTVSDPSGELISQTVTEVSQQSWQGQSGLAVTSTPEGRRFYELLASPSSGVRLHLTLAEREGRCIAYLLGVEQSAVYHALDTGFEPAFADYSPGLLVHFAALRDLCSRHLHECELGFDHPYKERFEPEHRDGIELVTFRTGLYRAYGHIINRVKRLRLSYRRGAVAGMLAVPLLDDLLDYTANAVSSFVCQ